MWMTYRLSLFILLFAFTTSCSTEQHAPSDFSVQLSEEHNIILITREAQTYTKSIQFNGDTTVKINITPLQIDSIYQVLSSINYYAYPLSITAKCTEKAIPSGEDYTLTVKENNTSRTIRYYSECHRYDYNDKKGRDFRKVLATIIHMAERQKSVQGLPDSGFIDL
ncbi:hypothetical protein [Hymenobacter cellulosivorans]|uniref:Lipoprotein n=1 Tax=Hymenobacter cellulosivorans TaxID=2932249 RepID=A0ABY4FJU5_9BACT|nr:hypothetical protein [Hymenobacter cellulosivorans]UOQ54836.1 hypothetical protein MUN80_08770 [Hymenobacter cellulosivorans]